jgi:hypothetical protein
VETVMTNRPDSGTAHFAKVNAEEVDGGFAWGDLHLRNAVRAFGQIGYIHPRSPSPPCAGGARAQGDRRGQPRTAPKRQFRLSNARVVD